MRDFYFYACVGGCLLAATIVLALLITAALATVIVLRSGDSPRVGATTATPTLTPTMTPPIVNYVLGNPGPTAADSVRVTFVEVSFNAAGLQVAEVVHATAAVLAGGGAPSLRIAGDGALF